MKNTTTRPERFTASALFGLSVAGMTRTINELQALVDRVKQVPVEPIAARKKYGASLIRVNWQYAGVAFKRPELKHVCTWSDGDEGFVFRKPNDEMRNRHLEQTPPEKETSK